MILSQRVLFSTFFILSGLGCGSRTSPQLEDPERKTRLEEAASRAVNRFDTPVLDIGEAALWIQQNPDILLVDTRTQQEYEVSHLPGATHWDVEGGNPLPPNLTQAGDAGRQVLFYCSIGYRSGKACRRFLDIYPDAKTFNIKGGLFQWAEQMGVLEGGDQVHPYDETWGDLLRPDLRWSANKDAQTK